MIDSKDLQLLAGKLLGTCDHPEEAIEDITGQSWQGEEWEDLLLSFDIQQCDQCGVWKEIHDFENGGPEGLTCEECLNV